MGDEVEVLAGVVVDLDVPLEAGRGVAPAGSVLAGRESRTLRAGAEQARAVRPAPARQEPVGEATGHRAHPCLRAR